MIAPRLRRFLIALLVVPAIQLLSAALLPAHGADAADVALKDADNTLILISAAMVLLMTPGLAFFYGGFVQARNVLNTMVMEENFRHATMEELERTLLVKIKDWIERERPKANACEAPWKTYVREYYESLYASGMSQENLANMREARIDSVGEMDFANPLESATQERD